MNKLDRLIHELSGEEVSKSTSLKKEVLLSELNEAQLDEALGDMLKKAKVWLQTAGKNITKNIKGAKIFFKQIGNKIFPFYKKGKETGVIDAKTGKVILKYAGSETKRTVLINTRLIVNESKSVFDKILSELRTKSDIEKITIQKIDDIGQRAQDVSDAPDDALDFINTARVDFDDLYQILDETAFSLKYRTSYKQDVPSLLLMGPPGAAKTSVIKQFAKNKGMKLKILEISSLYKEILGGFPVIQKLLKPGVAVDLSDEEKSKLSDEYKDIEIKIKNSDVLPPSKDGNPWILFLDEFNRDADKMGAAMNLVLTGNIGTSYFLPIKTIVVASGNLGEDIDGVPVADMDSATWDRFNRKTLLAYDWIARAEYGETEDRFGETEKDDKDYKIDKKYFEKSDKHNMGGDPSIIKNFMLRTSKEKGEDDWSISLKQFNPDAPSTRITPRTLSKMSDNMKVSALKDWTEDKLVGKKKKEWYEDNYEDRDFPSAPAYYLHVNQLNSKYFREIARTTLGDKAGDIITDMFTKFQKTKQEATTMSVEDVVLKWSAIREKGKKKIPSQIKNEFAMRLPSFLDNIGTKAKFNSMVKDAGVNLAEYNIDKGDEHIWAAVNIHNFIKDSKLGLDLATGVAKQLAELRSPTPDGDEEDEGDEKAKKAKKSTKKKPVKKEFLDDVLGYLINESKIFGEAWQTVADAVENDFGNTEEFKQAQMLAKKGMMFSGPPPSYIADRLSGKNLYNYLLITSMQQKEPKILDKVQSLKKQEKDKVEEAMKNLFKKMYK